MPQVNPWVRMRLTHPQELALHLLNGSLLHAGRNEQQFVRARGQWTGAICRVTATRARLPLKRTLIHRGHKRLRKRGQQGLKCGSRESGQRS
jgi:hypothetical protein